nr:hypothetical protein [Tanacetum cinerariifolium]
VAVSHMAFLKCKYSHD